MKMIGQCPPSVLDIVIVVSFYRSLLVKKGDYMVNVFMLLCTASVFGEDRGYIYSGGDLES